ncbi:hypothetical protein [Candidatus Litorirhabdus singularis]|nr:hypothetical protein [Candidatus Litorirhabdus singularis]
MAVGRSSGPGIKGLQVCGRVENLLDEDYEEVPTYNTTGTAGYAGVRWSF